MDDPEIAIAVRWRDEEGCKYVITRNINGEADVYIEKTDVVGRPYLNSLPDIDAALQAAIYEILRLHILLEDANEIARGRNN